MVTGYIFRLKSIVGGFSYWNLRQSFPLCPGSINTLKERPLYSGKVPTPTSMLHCGEHQTEEIELSTILSFLWYFNNFNLWPPYPQDLERYGSRFLAGDDHCFIPHCSSDSVKPSDSINLDDLTWVYGPSRATEWSGSDRSTRIFRKSWSNFAYPNRILVEKM